MSSIDEYVVWKNSHDDPKKFEGIVRLGLESHEPMLPMEALSSHWKLTWNTVLKYPYVPWKWRLLSDNPNITLKIILDNPSRPWDWEVVSRRHFVTWDVITSNPHIPWHPGGVSENPNITMDIVKKNPKFGWDHRALAMNSSIVPSDHWEITKDYSSCYLWNHSMHLSSLPDSTMLECLRMSLHNLKSNLTLPLDFIREHYGNDPDFTDFSYNVGVTIDFVLEYKTKMWSWSYLSEVFPIRDIVAHLELPWDTYGLSRNPDVTLSFLQATSIPIDWKELSSSPLLTIEFVISNPQIKWNWGRITTNSAISLQDMKDHPNLPWEWNYVMSNPNVTSKLIAELNLPRDQLWRLAFNFLDLHDFEGLAQEGYYPPRPFELYPCVRRDIKERRDEVLTILREIPDLYEDICSEILTFVSYD